MRTSCLLCGLLLIVAPACAQSSRPLKLDPSANPQSLPVKPKHDSSCATYGAGFVKLEGTNTCVKIGGSISVGAGGGIRH